MSDFTVEQQRFILHIADCHSWHKHLSLLKGGQFIIATTKSAGLNYPINHPKLPFGNSIEGYQKAFGELIFLWKNDNENHFYSDGLINPLTLENIESNYPNIKHLNLYPYLSSGFLEAIPYHKEGFEKIKHGYEHEQGEILNSLYDNYIEMQFYWNDVLTDEDRAIINSDIDDFLNQNIHIYNSLEGEVLKKLEKLREIEIHKIKEAIIKIKAVPN